MLSGPCETAFKKWDLCVEKAKANNEAFEEKCVDLTGNILFINH